jgi:uncharacterized HAD superfamily protein
MILYQKIINHKINSITTEELMDYAKDYEIHLTFDQANKIVKVIRGKKIDIFNAEQRKQLLIQIAKITNADVAKKVNELFIKFTK